VLASPTPVLASPTPVLASPTPVLASPTPVLASPTPVLASAVTVLTTAASAAPQDTTFSLIAIRTELPPVIDGDVSEEEWSGAARATDFIQYEPRRGTPSDYRTEALVLYDAGHLYVAFVVWDPDEPAAQLTRRDADLTSDDTAILILDTHHDRQSAYYFMINALGTQTDGRIANDGRTVDDTWDAAWQSAAQRTEFGWTVEMAIPFTSIAYASGDDRTWGINFGRSRRRTLELSFWSGPLEDPGRVSQAGSLSGLNVDPPPRRHQVIVYGLSRLQEDTTANWDAGVDLRYAITSQLSAYATVNPDFATIEADQERTNLTRFEVSLTEKRPFFLEGAELFRQRIRTFYSRRIPDITVGGQVLGKNDAWSIAGLGARSEPLGDSTVATYSVGRVQRNFGPSNVALTVADRTLSGEHEGSLGADATLFFTKTLGMTAQLIQSWGEFDSGTWGYFIRPSWDTPTSHFHVRYTHLGDRFADNVNAIGFIRDDDRRELDSALEHTFWIRNSVLERLSYDSNYNIYWGQTGTLRSWQIDQGVDFEFRNRMSLGGDYKEEFKRFEKDFRNRSVEVEIGYNTREFQSVQAGVEFGRNFDADFQLWTATAAYKLTEQLSVEYELERLTLDPDPELESTWIHVLRTNQFFTKDLFLRLFLQTNSAIDRRNIQAVIVYRYLPPFGTLQLAYQRGTAGFGERSEQGNTLFLKGTVVF
jgi:hypothetical protein